jgi:hypothetical protein
MFSIRENLQTEGRFYYQIMRIWASADAVAAAVSTIGTYGKWRSALPSRPYPQLCAVLELGQRREHASFQRGRRPFESQEPNREFDSGLVMFATKTFSRLKNNSHDIGINCTS